MHPHCTSFVLSRRQFLNWMLGLGAWAILQPAEAIGTTFLSSGWKEPVWVLSLADQTFGFSTGFAVPHALPGSLMKLVAATALLEEKLISTNTVLECRGSLRTERQTFHCQHAHGKLTISEAIGFSCNLFFAQAAAGLSVRRFLQYAALFRLNEPTAGKAPFVFPKEWTNEQPAQSYVLGLNRNLQPNALQLARMAGLIAKRQVTGIHPSTWQTLQTGMRIAALRGTAAELGANQKFSIVAKTGTTQHGHAFQSWVIGYFPIEEPRYAFCARAGAGTAKEQAVPLAHHFLASRQWQ